jgi:3-oxoacyl-(acyl-carrier-protein) synthase
MAALVSQDLQTPVVVFCGDNKSTPYDLWHFSSLGAMDNTTGRPFDSTSQGLRMGTCCVAFLVKHPSVKFNYPVQAVIDNFYFYTNSSLMVHPGTADELLTNLGNIQYKSTDLWNAHATGTPIGDRVEYEFFSNAVKHDVPIVGFKGYVGHCMSAAGAIEIAMALDCKKNNRLLPNIIQGEPIANDSRIIVLPTSFDYKRMIKPSLGFGGKTAVVEVTFE